jgi:hypothetical protein
MEPPMETKSELERFLESRAAEGQIDSRDASFTHAARDALRKIANFQLPREGAWAVKIIQSIVAGGSKSPVRVDLLATSIRFYYLEPGFTLDELAAAFHQPRPSTNRALRHLLSGLWSVGLKNRWGFQVAFPRESRTLIWDGDQLRSFESQKTRDCVCIDVAPLHSKTSLSWVAALAASGRRNAEVLSALAQKCYVCPLPLTVDARRLDSLQRSEHQGWSKTAYPLSIGFAQADLPMLSVPPGTFEPLPKSLDPTTFAFGSASGGGWRQTAEKRMKGLTAQDRTSVAYVLSVHMKEVRSGKTTVWEAHTGPSIIYWVLDGAVVGFEPLLERTNHCSVGCFLSAEGLETDLSTLSLLENPERRQRARLACQAVGESLCSLPDGAFEDMVGNAALRERVLGGLVMAVGVGLFWAFPWHGIGAAAVGVGIYGTAGKKERRQVELTHSTVRELVQQLGKAGQAD